MITLLTFLYEKFFGDKTLELGTFILTMILDTVVSQTLIILLIVLGHLSNGIQIPVIVH